MQHGGLALLQRAQAAIDRGSEIIRLGNTFAMRAERSRDSGEIPLLALTARRQPRLKLVGFRGNALWINPLHCRFHRLPAAIVEHNSQNRNLVLLRHRVDGVGRGEMKSAIADDLYDTATRAGQFQPQRHAAAEAKSAAGEADVALRLGARDVLLQDRCVADLLVVKDVAPATFFLS